MIRSVASLFATLLALAEPTPPQASGDPSKVEIALPAGPGWQARLIHVGDAGIWTVGTIDAIPNNGPPEVFALDDKGRCRILSCYSQRWTTWNTIEDFEWLGAFANVDLDPPTAGVEMYTGGKRGNLYRIVAHDGGFDTALIAKFPGEELHTAIGGDLLRSRPGNELLVFTHLGNAYDIQPDATSPSHVRGVLHAVVPGRVRQAILLPSTEERDPEIAVVMRSGEVALLEMKAKGFALNVVLKEPMGFGRLALREPATGQPLTLYATRDDGVVVRLERRQDGSFAREVIFAGPQGPRGIAAGRFAADPAVETVAVFGYSAKVQLLSRKGNDPWKAETIFEDADRGHWLHALEIDGRNSTSELIGSGYAGRVFLLARDPGYGLEGVPVDPGPLKPPIQADPPPPPSAGQRSTSALDEPRSAATSAPRLAVVSKAASRAELLPFGYRGGFETKTLLFDTLVRGDARGRIHPGLAESWEIANEGRRFEFTLRAGATFSDGSPIDARAVRLHLRRVLGLPEHAWIPASNHVIDVSEVTDRVVRVELDRPRALLQDLCAINPFAIAAPSCFSKDGERVAAIGGGNYRLDAFGTGDAWSLSRAPSGAARLSAALDLVPFATADSAAIHAAFTAGRIDGYADGAYEVVDRAALAELRGLRDSTLIETAGSVVISLSFRDAGIVSDRAVRRAVAAAIDRQRIVVALHGAADPKSRFANSAAPSGAPTTTRPGTPLRLIVREGSADQPIGRAVVESLVAGGIASELRSLDAATYDRVLAAGEFDLRIERTWGVPYDPYLTLVNRFLPPPVHPAAATVRSSDADPEVAARVLRLTECAQPADFENALEDVYRTIDATLALVPLVVPRRYAVFRASRLRLEIGEDLYRVVPLEP